MSVKYSLTTSSGDWRCPDQPWVTTLPTPLLSLSLPWQHCWSEVFHCTQNCHAIHSSIANCSHKLNIPAMQLKSAICFCKPFPVVCIIWPSQALGSLHSQLWMEGFTVGPELIKLFSWIWLQTMLSELSPPCSSFAKLWRSTSKTNHSNISSMKSVIFY